MPPALVWLSATVLTFVFAWAALAKILRFEAWRRALAAYGFAAAGGRVTAIAVPLVEAGIAILLAFVSVRIGSALSVALLAGFSFAVLRAKARQGRRLPCGCFGRTKARDYRVMIGRNAILAVLAAVVAISGEKDALLSGMEVPSAGEVLPAVLALLGVGLIAIVVWQASRVLSDPTRAASTGNHGGRRPH